MEPYPEFSRIVIVGGPRCGKTRLSEGFSRPVWHTDEVILDDLRASGEEVSWWFERPGPWVIEGVSGTVALEAWLRRYYYRPISERPCDCVLALWAPLVRLTWDQRDMLRQLREQWGEVQWRLLRCGVTVRKVLVHRTAAPVTLRAV